jgi:hypothetical protein
MNVYPGTIPDLEIQLDTPAWFSWLSSTNQFKYMGNLVEMSVKRRANGKWYARKKVYSSSGSKPIDLYIGEDSDCTSEKLREINACFGKDWQDFWTWYYSPERKEGKSKGAHNSLMYTDMKATLQTQEEISFTVVDFASLSNAITQSLAEIEELKTKRRQDLDFCHVRAVGLSDEIRELESRLQLSALEKIRDRLLLKQPPTKRRELKKAFDALIAEIALDVTVSA